MLSRFPNSTLKVGAKVSLAPEAEYEVTSNNPRGIVGVVKNINYTSWVLVEWSNTTTNIYQKRHYDLIAEGEPGFLVATR